MMASVLPNIRSRSLGVKLIAVGMMALIMAIPAIFVNGVVEERSHRAAAVSNSIGSVLGGQQSFLGPVLAVPYTVTSALLPPVYGIHVIFPVTGDADVATKSEVRKLSLFRVPVYRANISFKASFEIPSVSANLPSNAQLNWNEAEFITGASDSRGALADAAMTIQGATKSMGLSGLSNRLPTPTQEHPAIPLRTFGLRAGDVAHPGARVDVAINMRFSGSERLSVLPFGKTTSITMTGDWPNPGFSGGFLPVTQNVSSSGFQARWSVPFIARGMESEGDYDLIPRLLPMASSLAFVELANPYQSVTRSLKYALLFLSLVFAAFFVFETTTGKRVHPAQYFLVGAAQLIFYLLLLSIAERIGFGAAFAIASAATISLISIDANWIFQSRVQGFRACVVFSVLYALIYVLLTLEDQALLVGSVASFLAVAGIMYFTRSIDWYSQGSGATAGPAQS